MLSRLIRIIHLKIVVIVAAKYLRLYHSELPNCHKCGTVLDRDENAARNILNKALSEVGLILPACGGLDVSQPVKQETSETWVQLSLF